MEKARAASSGYREGRGRKGGEDPFEWNEVRLGEDGKGEGKGGGEGGVLMQLSQVSTRVSVSGAS